MEIFSGKIQAINVSNGEGIIAIFNREQANQYGITEKDKVALIRKGEEYIVDVALSNDLLEPGTIGASKELLDEYPINDGDQVLVAFTQNNPLSLQAIRKKLLGEKITAEEIDAIVEDMQNNKLSDLLLAYYTATSFFYKSDPEELAYTTKATANTGDIYRFPGIVASKYSIGGVPGNETTMIIVPIIASLGITIPKTFSKSITSPAATWECVEVLMQTSLKKNQIVRLIDKHGACLAWNGNLNLAPANDRIIKVSAPLGMEPFARMISSIMAKNYAMGITHCLIEVPVGPTAKVTNDHDAQRIADHFKYIGEELWITTEVAITEALEPIGSGIWAVLQAQEALRILQQHPQKSESLEYKSLDLSAQLILLVGKAKDYPTAFKMAQEVLQSGQAWKKMQALIQDQKANIKELNAEKIVLAPHQISCKALKSGKISSIDMRHLNTVARALGAPIDAQAGLILHVRLGKQVKKGDPIFTLYSNSLNKIKITKELLKEKNIYQIN